MHSRIKNMLSRPLNINNYTFFKQIETQDARDLIPVDRVKVRTARRKNGS